MDDTVESYGQAEEHRGPDRKRAGRRCHRNRIGKVRQNANACQCEIRVRYKYKACAKAFRGRVGQGMDKDPRQAVLGGGGSVGMGVSNKDLVQAGPNVSNRKESPIASPAISVAVFL